MGMGNQITEALEHVFRAHLLPFLAKFDVLGVALRANLRAKRQQALTGRVIYLMHAHNRQDFFPLARRLRLTFPLLTAVFYGVALRLIPVPSRQNVRHSVSALDHTA